VTTPDDNTDRRGTRRQRRAAKARFKSIPWVSLFDDSEYPKAVIARRPFPDGLDADARSIEARILRVAHTPEHVLCSNVDCDNAIHSAPDVMGFILARRGDDRVVGSSICPDCASKGRAAILDVLRNVAMHIGFAPLRGAVAEMDIGPSASAVARPPCGLELLELLEEGQEICHVTRQLMSLIDGGHLPDFTTYASRGHGNCHHITGVLVRELRRLGLVGFDNKIGFSGVLKSDGEPVGLHSWIEREGWAIDAAGGGLGRPILIAPVERYRKLFQLTDVRDRDRGVQG
jgi:hypothetical protein